MSYAQIDGDEPTWRCKHKIGNILSRVIKHANGEIEMTASQLKAAEIYLRKTVPDLNRTTLVGDKENKLDITVNVVRKD